ncbi:MAG TPA: NHL repeat-containing protein [Solirubrobacterales bacterium]|nr:NHL repeat-containing protein [Solirubrobacterales bacterium]
MSPRRLGAALGTLCWVLALVGAAPAARAAFDDPLAVIRPVPPPAGSPRVPPPEGDLEAPCGIAVDEDGDFHVAEYYRNAIDVFGSALKSTYPYGYKGQATGIADPLGGPCTLAFDADGGLYVNDFHRSVLRYDSSLSAGTALSGAGTADGARPTGVAVDQGSGAVYVNQRTQIAVFSSVGAPIRTLGAGSLLDGYGVAVSEYPSTEGLLYVADAATDTVKVYAPEPLSSEAGPVAEIDGSATPLGHFVSLRDAAIAIDRENGQVYVSDNLQPEYAERPETVVHVFDAGGGYLGRLKYSVSNAVPPGLAVDNSETPTQGRVYLTSGNTMRAAIYAYPSGAATTSAVPLPSLATTGAGSGSSERPDSEAALVGPPRLLPPAPTYLPAPASAAKGAGPGGKPAKRRQARHKAEKHHPRHRAGRRAER